MSDKLIEAIVSLREDDARTVVGETLDSGTDPQLILAQCRQAMSLVGERFEAGEYFLPELVMAGEILSEIAAIVKPRLENAVDRGAEREGRVLIGTVQGDVHDIGKDIVVFMLDVNGFEVHDLGIDVPPVTFVEQIEAVKPHVVGLSGFLTVAFDAMKDTVEAIGNAGQRDRVKIMIGGGMVDEHILGHAGADAYGNDAMEAVSLVKDWVGGS